VKKGAKNETNPIQIGNAILPTRNRTAKAESLTLERKKGEIAAAKKMFSSLNNREKEELHKLLLKIVTDLQNEPGPRMGWGRHRREQGPGGKGGRGRRR